MRRKQKHTNCGAPYMYLNVKPSNQTLTIIMARAKKAESSPSPRAKEKISFPNSKNMRPPFPVSIRQGRPPQKKNDKKWTY